MPFVTKQRLLTRTVDTRDISESGSVTIDLPLGYDQNSIIVKLSGTITIGTAPTAYHDYAIARLVQRIDVFSNGKNKTHEVTGLAAALANFERQGNSQYTDIAAGTGAKSVECYFRLDNVNADGMRPKDSSLHTVKPFMTKQQIKIQLGSVAGDMVKTAGSFALTSVALTVEILVEETIEYSDAAYFEDRLVKVQSIIEETVDATKSNHRIKLATGELMLRGVKLVVLDETGSLSDAVINSAQLKSGVDVAYSRDVQSIKEANNSDYLLGANQKTGIYYLDMCPDGKLNKLWDTRGLSELDLVLDVTKPAGGDATVYAIPVQFYEQNNSGVRKSLESM